MLVKSQYVIGVMHSLGISRLESRRGLAITADYVRTFFDVYLKDASADSLNQPAQRYPEVQVGAP
jgi:hypothetical protein